MYCVFHMKIKISLLKKKIKGNFSDLNNQIDNSIRWTILAPTNIKCKKLKTFYVNDTQCTCSRYK